MGGANALTKKQIGNLLRNFNLAPKLCELCIQNFAYKTIMKRFGCQNSKCGHPLTFPHATDDFLATNLCMSDFLGLQPNRIFADKLQ